MWQAVLVCIKKESGQLVHSSVAGFLSNTPETQDLIPGILEEKKKRVVFPWMEDAASEHHLEHSSVSLLCIPSPSFTTLGSTMLAL